MAVVKGLQSLVTESVQPTSVIPDSHLANSFRIQKSKQTYSVMSNQSNHDFPHKIFCYHTCFDSINITEAARIWFGSILGI